MHRTHPSGSAHRRCSIQFTIIFIAALTITSGLFGGPQQAFMAPDVFKLPTSEVGSARIKSSSPSFSAPQINGTSARDGKDQKANFEPSSVDSKTLINIYPSTPFATDQESLTLVRIKLDGNRETLVEKVNENELNLLGLLETNANPGADRFDLGIQSTTSDIAFCDIVSFAAATNFATSANPSSVALGDFNSDGKPDLAVTNSPNVSILLATSAGSFSSPTNFGAGSSPNSIGLGDFNGDGMLDLAVANYNSANVSILLGMGTGNFSAAKNFTAGPTPYFVAVGDFNADGKLDLVTANWVSNSVSILLGAGTGSFSSGTNFTAGTTPIAVAVADYNGDAKLDLAVANQNSGNVSILLGSGTGGFGGATNFDAGSNPTSVAAGDFNGDGKLDLAIGRDGSTVFSTLLGNGTGSFGAPSIFNVGTTPQSVAMGDFNRDGNLDLVTANPASNSVSILRGDGTGSFGAATNFAAGSSPESVAVGDLNGDGNLDLAVANRSSTNVSILLNNAPTSATPTTFTVTSTNDSGTGSLRQAILNANANCGADTINFSIGSGVQTIQPLSPLPKITDPVTIDATTQPGFAGDPIIELSGANAGSNVNGLTIDAGTSTVRGFVINRYYIGILLEAKGNNILAGNFIGTNVGGSSAVANSFGVVVVSPNNTIGGLLQSSRNVISGNSAASLNGNVGLDIESTGNTVVGNYIGTDKTGTAAVANGSETCNSSGCVIRGGGIQILDGSNNIIGGTRPEARNIISGNKADGILIFASSNQTASKNQVLGNFIGTDVTGTVAIRNTNHTIQVQLDGITMFFPDTNTIGGAEPGARNVISGGNGTGLSIYGSGNLVRGNYIGTDVSGTKNLGNGRGISIGLGGASSTASKNVIGGTNSGEGNIIAFNSFGIDITGDMATDNLIRSNSVFSNDLLGINLRDGTSTHVTPNDPGDTDAGPNNLQNFPVLIKALSNSGSTTIEGMLNSKPNTVFTIELFSNVDCHSTGYGEGKSSLGLVSATTDSTGNATFSTSITNGVPAGHFVTATATDPNSNTSEFSQCVPVAKSNQTITFNALGDKSYGSAPFNVSATSSSGLPVSFSIVSGPATLSGNTITITGVGVVTVRASQPGDANFNAAIPVEQSFTVSKANQTITFNALANKIFGDGPFNVSATSSSGLPVSFSTVLGPATISGNTISITGVGVVTIRASQAGDANYNAATPVDRSFTVEAGTFQPVVLTADQAEIKAWTIGGRTSAYLKLLFPDAGYRVANWGQPVRAVNDFSADAAVEKFTGASVQAVTTTAQIYDLGVVADGNYTFTFKNSSVVVKSQAFTVSSATPPPNPIDNVREFVKQQYRDFLNREADQAGEDFWTDNITKCSDPARRPAGQTEAQCTLRQRETTSGAFFLSPEFQYTGYFVYRMYQGALGRQPKLSEFTPDAQFVGAGIIVNGQLSAAKINQNKADFAALFVNCTDATKYRCAEFKGIYDGLSNQEYVNKLFQTTVVNASAPDKAALVNGLNANPATETRASVLQKVVDGIVVIAEGNQQFTTSYGQAFYNSESNRAFVQLEYFGYMKRDPDDGGYAFWLGKLNLFGGNFVNAEMVLAFISSPEYRARFGQP